MYHALYSAAVDQLHARLPAFREHLRISAVRFTTDRERAAHLGGAELYVGPAVGRDESAPFHWTFGSSGSIDRLARTLPRSSTISSARPRNTGRSKTVAAIPMCGRTS